jgi:hypothetical protein
MNTILVDVLQQPGTAFGVPPTASGPTQPQFVSASALSGTLFTIKSAGTAVTAASLTSIFPGSSAVGSLVLPANFFVPGRSLELTMFGYYTAAATTSMTLAIKLNTLTLCTSASSSVTTNASAAAWQLTGVITCYAVGSPPTPTVVGGGMAIVGVAPVGLVQSTIQQVDTTIAQTIDIQAAFSAGSGSFTLQGIYIDTYN